jgi:hypothetical protein
LQIINTNRIINKLVKIGPQFIFAAYIIKWCYGFIKDGMINNDFFVFWVAASLSTSGKAALIYDFSFFKAALESITGGPFPVAWFYPPTFLLILFPFSLLPFLAALVIWLSATIFCFVLVMRRIAPHHTTVWLTLAYPATLLNIGYGQNGLLSAALIGGGLFLINESPFIAGTLFGLLTYKPHIAFLLPIAFLAGRQWKVLIAFIISSITMVLLSVVTWGLDTWTAFFHNIPLSARFLEPGFQGWIQDWHKMASIYSAILLIGFPEQVAFIVQVAVMLTVTVIISLIWFKNSSISISMRASTLTLGVLLFTPHLLEYDLAILALPIAWISWDGHTKGWLSGEKCVLFISWFTPLLSILLLKVSDLQIVPIVLVLMLCLTLRRIFSHDIL